MDEAGVRASADEHAQAVVAGDLRAAGSCLTEGSRAQAPGVMGAMPNPVTSAEVTSVDGDGGVYVAQIRYAGESGETIVESRWEERDGEPKLVDMKVL